MRFTFTNLGTFSIRRASKRLFLSLSMLAIYANVVQPLNADLITGISAINQSFSSNPTASFFTQSTLSGVSTSGNTSSFTHRMAVLNQLTAGGGVAQTQKGNVVFTLNFTINDPLNQGYDISLANVVRGISTINITGNPLNAICYTTGLHLPAYNGTNFLNGISGSTLGTGFQFAGSHAIYEEISGNHFLGSFSGTQTFSLELSSFFTPTTDVIFANNATGLGEVIYGLGTIPNGFQQYNINDLGHFLTVSVTPIPEPSAGMLVSTLVGSLLIRRRKT